MYPVDYNNDAFPFDEMDYGMLYFQDEGQNNYPFSPGGSQQNYLYDYGASGYTNYVATGESPIKSPSRFVPQYVWDDEFPSNLEEMEVLDEGMVIPTNDRQQELYIQDLLPENQDEILNTLPIAQAEGHFLLDEGQVDTRTDALINITDGDVNDFFITKEPVVKIRKSQHPRLPAGSSTWVDPNAETYNCMWSKCTARNLTTKADLRTHVEEHLKTFTGHQGYSYGPEKEGFKCPIHGCCFSSRFKAAVENHIIMHVHHAARQMEALAYMRKSEDLKHTQGCGFRPILHLSFEGMEMSCSWEYCDKSFEDVTNFYNHLAEHVDNSDRGDKVFNRYHCGWFECNKEFDHRGDLRKHACRHVNWKKCACPFCGAFMNSWEKFSIHLKRRKEKHEEYECLKCLKKFPTETILNNHIRAHVYNTKCEVCDTPFRNNYELGRHNQLKHKGVIPKSSKIWRCEFENCGRVFKTWNKLTAHKVEHNIAQFACKFCPCKFIYQLQLNRHKMKFHPEAMKKPSDAYECHICMKTMNTSSKLSYHLKRIHRFTPPVGFTRFTYQKCSDSIFRVCTVKLTRQSLEEED